MPNIRCFLAVPADPKVRAAVVALSSGVQSSASGIRWEDPMKLHLTLKFLGSVDPGILTKLSDDIASLISYHSSFDMIYEGVGAFPSVDRPKILWVGVRGDEQMIHLQRDIEHVAKKFGFAEDDKPFHPHITIARVKRSDTSHRLTAILKSLTFEPISGRCTEVLVMRSEPGPDSSRYTVLHTIPLRS
jgi:2'-5' RNA ligase